MKKEGASIVTRHKLHDNHDGLLLYTDANELDNVWVVVLLENTSLLEKFFLVLLWQTDPAGFDSHIYPLWMQHCPVHISKVALQEGIKICFTQWYLHSVHLRIPFNEICIQVITVLITNL